MVAVALFFLEFLLVIDFASTGGEHAVQTRGVRDPAPHEHLRRRDVVLHPERAQEGPDCTRAGREELKVLPGQEGEGDRQGAPGHQDAQGQPDRACGRDESRGAEAGLHQAGNQTGHGQGAARVVHAVAGEDRFREEGPHAHAIVLVQKVVHRGSDNAQGALRLSGGGDVAEGRLELAHRQFAKLAEEEQWTCVEERHGRQKAKGRGLYLSVFISVPIGYCAFVTQWGRLVTRSFKYTDRDC